MIEVAGGYCVRADTRQYIVGRPYIGKDGSLRTRNPRYLSTMERAVTYIAEQVLRDKVAKEEITTLRDFIREFRALKQELTRQIEPLKIQMQDIFETEE